MFLRATNLKCLKIAISGCERELPKQLRRYEIKGEILSGTLERLVAEVGDVSEAVRDRLREIEDAEKKLVEMKR